MALALNNLKKVDMPLNKETKPFKIFLIEQFLSGSRDFWKLYYESVVFQMIM